MTARTMVTASIRPPNAAVAGTNMATASNFEEACHHPKSLANANLVEAINHHLCVRELAPPAARNAAAASRRRVQEMILTFLAGVVVVVREFVFIFLFLTSFQMCQAANF
ncbi:hypothetical protein [Mesorhizobium sp. Cs1299R1N3]|uniref:hypothetical protein n=1 Tax=Mesorhizobium sp. Cs1299R1N3 TaxID=3015173 RepID=UPI00301DF301